MELSSTPPFWLFALVLAGVAPWLVRLFADGLEHRVRRRTEALLARVTPDATQGTGDMARDEGPPTETADGG